jgi:hypothetical protein
MAWFASLLNAEGAKSRSRSWHPTQRSVTVTVTLLPWSVEVYISILDGCYQRPLTGRGQFLSTDRVLVWVATAVATGKS